MIENGAVPENFTFFTRHPDEEVDDMSKSRKGMFSVILNHFLKAPRVEILNDGDHTVGEVDRSAQDDVILQKNNDDGSCSDAASTSQSGHDEAEFSSRNRESVQEDSQNRKQRLFHLSSMFKSRNPSLVDYNRSSFRRYWMPDSSGRECYECQDRFTAFRRRHHCRLCGQIFCSKCCNVQVSGSLFGYIGDLRLCGYCAQIVMSSLPQIDAKVEDSLYSDDKTPGTEMDPSVSTIFAGPVTWSLEANDTDSSLTHSMLSEKLTNSQSPAQLSVAELAFSEISNARAVISQASGVDDHEPEWVKNIEMTENKVDENGYSRLHPLGSESSDNKGDASKEWAEAKRMQNCSLSPVVKNDCPTVDGDWERCFDQQAEKLLLQLFKREKLSPTVWWDIIWTVSHQVASLVKVEMEGRRNSHLLKHVHIKRLNVDVEEPSATVIEGVVFNKYIRHETMPNEIRNASVLTVEGSIEYERVMDKITAIDTIIAQENEYLRNQVDRMLSHRPSIVLVERNVSGCAMQMLQRAGVTLISNIKPWVLRRVARSTGADVMPSLDAQLLNQKTGFCPYFKQEKIRIMNGKLKCLLMFAECPPQLGCSVVLRCNSKSDLLAAKRILRYAILALYSNRLEVKALAVHSVHPTKRCVDCYVCALNTDEAVDSSDEFCNRLRKSALTSSPLIDFGLPFLETRRGKQSSLRPFFKRFADVSTNESGNNTRRCIDNGNAKNEKSVLRRHQLVRDKTLKELNDDAIASFRALSGRFLYYNLRKCHREDCSEGSAVEVDDDVFNPFAHQQISILFGSYCQKSPNAPFFCIRPWIVSMEYYGKNDISLGDFMKRFCFNKDYPCPSANCEIAMMDHSRKIVHRNVCIEINTQSCVQMNDEINASAHSAGRNDDTLLTWHYCVCCKASSNVIPLPEDVCQLSFARYIGYLANGSFVSCNVSSFERACNHCCFHQHERYFANNNFVAHFKITPMRPCHVTFSPLVCTVEPMMFTRKFVAEFEDEIQKTVQAVFTSMSSQLEAMSNFADNSLYSHCYSQLLKTLNESRATYSALVKRFDKRRILSSDDLTIRSNDAVYTQAVDIICRCRYVVQHAIDAWNERCSHLSQQLRALKKGSANLLPMNFGFVAVEGNGDPNGATDDTVSQSNGMHPTNLEFELSCIESPFLTECHYSLPLPAPGMVAMTVRDVVDSKGVTRPDIGSIIAYALASVDNNGKRRKQRDGSFGSAINGNEYPSASEEHIEVDFADDKAQYYAKIYYANQFHTLRKLLFVEGEDCFLRSLSISRRWNPQGGKSGASFYRTQDDRFVFKQMSRFEIQSFVKFGPNYFSYISDAMTENKLTTLCKVYGVYRICYKNRTSGQQLKVDVLVMEYLFYRKNVKQVWDLKGSQRNRMASEKRSADLVLLDENLVKDLWNNQLYIHPHSKAALSMAIHNDSHFLSAQYVMDYSLLVGIDEMNNELIIGIVDYMRTYTLDKKLESWVKIVAIPGAHLPTVISPDMYCTRFADAIDTYFPMAPDQWTGLGTIFPSTGVY